LATAPEARGLVVCPTSEYSLTFEDGSAYLTDLAQETVAASMARTRACSVNFVVVLRSYSSDPQMSVARAHAVHLAMTRHPGSEGVSETRIVGCPGAVGGGDERVVATIYFIIPGQLARTIETSCGAGG
jgi:hypothetical protein